MAKIIACIIAATLLAIIAVALAIKLFFESERTRSSGMLVITYSDYDSDIEMILRNALATTDGVQIVAVYCGWKDALGGASEAYEICRRFAGDNSNVFCTTYDLFLQRLAEIKGQMWKGYPEA